MISRDDWERVKELFTDALELPVETRQAWLAAQCGDNHALRAELESLLESHDRPHRLFAHPTSVGPAPRPHAEDDLPPGARIGPYRIDRLIGRGGMGAVYHATRSDGVFEKGVAIKIVHVGVNSTAILRRFAGERQTLAGLAHPNIATLLDGGTASDGRPYFVMEYVAGLPIDAYCERHAQSLSEILRLFVRVCGAVQHAHQHLVVHRDLKPDNVLVGTDGEPKLLDFGIAKVVEPDPASPGTTIGFRPMTPQYASPEQVRGEPITTSTDIYSLGVLFYKLLTGELPYAVSNTSGPAIEREICETQPRRPSEAARGVGRPGAWRSRLKGDLDAVVLMALRKEPERRYASVEQLAEDLQRYLHGLPVVARPDTVRYRATKFVTRNRLATAAATAAVLTLVVGIMATSWTARIARREAAAAATEREKAQAEAARARRMNTFLTDVLALPDPNWYSPGAGGRPDMTVADLLRQAGKRIDSELGADPELAADLHHTLGSTSRARGWYEDARTHFATALALRQRVFGEHHAKVAESLYFLGAAEQTLGRVERGEALYTQAIAIERTLPVPDANYPHMLMDLGYWKSRRGAPEGEVMIREAMALFRERHGPESVTVAFARQRLGNVRQERGDLAGARVLYEEALAAFEKSPQRSIVIGELLVSLGDIAQLEGDLTSAESRYREAAQRLSATAGTDHPGVADPLLRLGALLLKQGRHAEAEIPATRALTILRARPDSRSEILIAALSLLGHAADGLGRRSDAERYRREAAALAAPAVPGHSRQP